MRALIIFFITINPDDNIFDIFQHVKNSEWGGNTDIDKANQKLAGMMHDYKKINPDFSGQINHIIFTAKIPIIYLSLFTLYNLPHSFSIKLVKCSILLNALPYHTAFIPSSR